MTHDFNDFVEEPDENEPDESETEAEETSDEDESEDLETAEEFTAKYGFEHNCTCAEDWATGNLGVVAVCYLNMCREALDLLAEKVSELESAQDEIAQLRIAAAD